MTAAAAQEAVQMISRFVDGSTYPIMFQTPLDLTTCFVSTKFRYWSVLLGFYISERVLACAVRAEVVIK